ncbi:unnamed protein product, partial [Rotaria socialis]
KGDTVPVDIKLKKSLDNRQQYNLSVVIKKIKVGLLNSNAIEDENSNNESNVKRRQRRRSSTISSDKRTVNVNTLFYAQRDSTSSNSDDDINSNEHSIPCSCIMNKNIQKNSQNKPSKSSRKSSSNSRRSTRSTDIPSQVPHRSETHSQKSSIDLGHDLLTEIIEDLTSDIDDTRPTSTSSILSKNSQTKNNEAISTSSKKLSLSINALRNPTCVPGKKSFRSSKKGVKSSQQQEKSNSPSCFNSFDETYDLNVARKSIGEQRRDRLTKHMKEFYQDFFEFDKNSNMNSTHDNLNNNDKRKQYSTALWYELKAYFNGANSLDENGIKNEQYSIDRQRKKFLDEFYTFFSHFGFEQSYHNDIPTIQRRHMCEHHLNHCHNVEKRMQSLFLKWDYILSLFPSYAALEQYDKRFNPRTQEGRIFYEKLYIFQAWLNLHSEINHLINILGRIMSSIKCHAWPN